MAWRLLSTGLLALTCAVLANGYQYACTKMAGQQEQPLLKQFNILRRMVGSPDLKWDNDLEQAAQAAAVQRFYQSCNLKGADAGDLVWGCASRGDCDEMGVSPTKNTVTAGQCKKLVDAWGLDNLKDFKFSSTMMYTDNKDNPNALAAAQILWAGATKMACATTPLTAVPTVGESYKCLVLVCRFDTPAVAMDEAWAQNIAPLGTPQKAAPSDKLDTCAGWKQLVPDMCSNDDYQYKQAPLYSYCPATCPTSADTPAR